MDREGKKKKKQGGEGKGIKNEKKGLVRANSRY